MLLLLLQKDILSQNQLFISYFAIPKKMCLVFLHLNNEEHFPPLIMKEMIKSSEMIKSIAALSGIPSLTHATVFWDLSSTCFEKYLPKLYPEEHSPLKSPQISDLP